MPIWTFVGEGIILLLLKNINHNQIFCNGLLFFLAPIDKLGAQANIYNLQNVLHQLKCKWLQVCTSFSLACFVVE